MNIFSLIHVNNTLIIIYLCNDLAVGTRLRRGYVHEAAIDDKPEDITHLVFVIHGIGQKMNQGNIIKRCAEYV